MMKYILNVKNISFEILSNTLSTYIYEKQLKFNYILIKKATLPIALFFAIALSAQNIKQDTVEKVMQSSMLSITKEDLKDHLNYLASAELKGRGTGESGQKKAAKYISGIFNQLSLEGPIDSKDKFYQNFKLYNRKILSFIISTDNIELDYSTEFMLDNKGNEFEGSADFSLIFIGYGLESDYQNIDVSGKVVIYFEGYPPAKKYDDIRLRDDIIIVTDEKTERAMSKGASGTIKIRMDEESARWFIKAISGFSYSRMRLNKPYDASGVDTLLPCILMPPSSAAKLLGIELKELYNIRNKIDKGEKPNRVLESVFHIESHYKNKELSTENVLGYLSGGELKEELIIVMAHYDHLGIMGKDIGYGANDNASGVAALIEIAEAFSISASKGIHPKRSILFMALTAEEKGLLGSKYYVSNPIFPLASTKLLLNMDMLGRSDFKHNTKSNYIYVDLSDSLNSPLYEICLKAELDNKSLLSPEYHFNNTSVATGMSDHMSFSDSKIPFLYYYNGIHKDYHKPTDTTDKIDYNSLEDITRYIYSTIYRFAVNYN